MGVFRRRGGYYSHRAARSADPVSVDELAFEKLIESALRQLSSAVTVTVQPKHPVLLGKEALEGVQI